MSRAGRGFPSPACNGPGPDEVSPVPCGGSPGPSTKVVWLLAPPVSFTPCALYRRDSCPFAGDRQGSMKLTRASSYALHAVAFMAVQKHDRPIASHNIAQARGIPERFLLKVLKPLVSARVLLSVKGPNGGDP